MNITNQYLNPSKIHGKKKKEKKERKKKTQTNKQNKINTQIKQKQAKEENIFLKRKKSRKQGDSITSRH